MASRIIWSEPETDLLVSERARRNEEYYFVYRGNKTGFWESTGGEYMEVW